MFREMLIDTLPIFLGLEDQAARHLGPKGRRLVERLIYRAERLLSLSDELTPPRHLRNQIGPFNDPVHYREVGRSVLDYFVESGLKPTSDVLDMGCGCGQMAAPLLGYLNGSSRYEGFDIGEEMIGWCRDNITARRPTFRFQALDLYNSYFRPHGRIKASELQFPYADGSFDFAFAKSLFTHLLPADAENYVAQTARVLRKGGRAWFSFFFIDDESRARIAAGKSTLDFRFPGPGYISVETEHPEHAIAYEEEKIVSLLRRYGLEPAGPTSYGSWSGRPAAGYQDSILSVRR